MVIGLCVGTRVMVNYIVVIVNKNYLKKQPNQTIMTEIYSNDHIRITKDRHVFKLYFSYANPALINSLTKTDVLPGATIMNNYKTVMFNSFSLKTFEKYKLERKNYLGTMDAMFIVASLSSQIKYLIKKENKIFLGFNPKNIFVLNDNTFIYLNNDLKEIKNNKILISSPFYQTDFLLSPELLKIKTIPSYVHYKTCYFSFGLLILYILSNDVNTFYTSVVYMNYLQKETSIQSVIYIKNILYSKGDTKLKWFLSRCLVEDPSKRVILFI